MAFIMRRSLHLFMKASPLYSSLKHCLAFVKITIKLYNMACNVIKRRVGNEKIWEETIDLLISCFSDAHS